MPATYEWINGTTVSNSTTNNISFTSIPQTYTDLVASISCWPLNNASNNPRLEGRINNDSGGNYYTEWLTGGGNPPSGSSPGTNIQGGQSFMRLSGVGELMDASAFANQYIVNYNNYTQSSYNKQVINIGYTVSATGGRNVGLFTHEWANTAAITSVQFVIEGNYFGVGSIFNLYGIKAA